MSVLVRFAPSPTGLMHLGNARTALVNWLFARRQQGRLVLRIDDTDNDRSTEPFVEAIRRDLAWLGLDCELEVRQSARTTSYEAALASLQAIGRAYPAFETAAELATARALARAAGRPPRYDRAALALRDADRARFLAEGRRAHWRLRLSDDEVTFDDLVRGPQTFELRHLSDPVLQRENGVFTYNFASVVDDLEMGISHVIRGEDHLTNTAVQLDLAAALGGAAPAFAHLPLLLDAEGGKLSKRLAGLSLADLRERGIQPAAVVAVLATLGTGRAAGMVLSQTALLEGFDLTAFGTAQPRLDPADLERLSTEWLRAAPFEAVASRLSALGLTGADARFWEVVRGNLDRLEDVVAWWQVLHTPLTPVLREPEFTDLAAERWAGAEAVDVRAWLSDLQQATGRKGRALYGPLRLALTAREHGPPLADLIALLGPDRAIRRLRGETV